MWSTWKHRKGASFYFVHHSVVFRFRFPSPLTSCHYLQNTIGISSVIITHHYHYNRLLHIIRCRPHYMSSLFSTSPPSLYIQQLHYNRSFRSYLTAWQHHNVFIPAAVFVISVSCVSFFKFSFVLVYRPCVCVCATFLSSCHNRTHPRHMDHIGRNASFAGKR